MIEKANGLHGFMNWKRNLLTVSAAFLNESVIAEKYTHKSATDM